MQEHLRDELSELLTEVGSLQSRLNSLEGRISELINREGSSATLPEAPSQPYLPKPTAPPEHEAPVPAAPTRQIPSPPAPPVVAAEADQVSPQERLSLEQRVGASWLNKIGVIVLILAAVFFFQYAVNKGWVNETIRVLIVAFAGILLLAAGEWAYRRAMRMFAGGVTAGGIALLYASAYAASPKFYNLLGTPTSFALMCVVTVLGVVLSLRSRMVTTAVLVQVGAYLTPFLLSTGRDEQVILMIYLLVIGSGFLFIAAAKRWSALAPIALAGTLILFVGWFVQFYTPPAALRTVAFAWAFMALFAVYAGLSTAAGREHPFTGIALLAVAAPAMVIMHLFQHNDLSCTSILVHWFVLDAMVLSLCSRRAWHWLRLGVFVWTLPGILILWHITPFVMTPWFWCTWAWLFFGLFLMNIITCTWWPAARTIERLDAALGAAATSAMFATTYYLLRAQYGDWMGLYTLLLAVAVLLLAWLLYKSAGKRLLAGSYLGQSLVLLALAVPIQFDKATVSLVWASQAAVAMLLARRFTSKLLTRISQIQLAHLRLIG